MYAKWLILMLAAVPAWAVADGGGVEHRDGVVWVDRIDRWAPTEDQWTAPDRTHGHARVTQPVHSIHPTSAPEMSASFAGSAISLLLGCLMVARGRREISTWATLTSPSTSPEV